MAVARKLGTDNIDNWGMGNPGNVIKHNRWENCMYALRDINETIL